jgi:TonB family protein
MSRVLRAWRESYAVKSTYGGSAGLSLVTHLGIVALAVIVTRHAPQTLKDEIEQLRVRWHVPEDRPAASAGQRQERIQFLALGVAPGTGPLTDLPDGHSPDAGERTQLDVVGKIGDADVRVPDMSRLLGVDSAYSVVEVDSIVQRDPLSAAPAYPAELLAAGVTGSALMRYVVDTSGRVDVRTIEPLRTSHALFARAVREALPLMRFSPAKIGPLPVRQLVEQEFFFKIDKPVPKTVAKPVAQSGHAAERTTP